MKPSVKNRTIEISESPYRVQVNGKDFQMQRSIAQFEKERNQVALDLRNLEERSLTKEALPGLQLEMEQRIIQRLRNTVATNLQTTHSYNYLEQIVHENAFWIAELKKQMKRRI